MMKKLVVISAVFIGALVLAACDSGGGSSASEKTNYTLGGALENGESVSLSLDVAESGSDRAAASYRTLSGFLVYDDMTLACSGDWDTVSGKFMVSARGSIAGVVTLVFSLVGIIENETVTSATITLTIYDGSDNLTGTYSSNLSETTETVTETSTSVTPAAATSSGFEGEWTASPITLVLTNTSYIYMNSYEDDFENGSLHMMKDGGGTDEWYIAYITDQDMFDELRDGGESVPSAYHAFLLRIAKARLVSGNLQLAYYDENVFDGGSESYVAANVNMTMLFSTGKFTSASFGIYEVSDDNGDDVIDDSDSFLPAGEALILDTVAAGLDYSSGVILEPAD